MFYETGGTGFIPDKKKCCMPNILEVSSVINKNYDHALLTLAKLSSHRKKVLGIALVILEYNVH